jgi:hypothetical protein
VHVHLKEAQLEETPRGAAVTANGVPVVARLSQVEDAISARRAHRRQAEQEAYLPAKSFSPGHAWAGARQKSAAGVNQSKGGSSSSPRKQWTPSASTIWAGAASKNRRCRRRIICTFPWRDHTGSPASWHRIALRCPRACWMVFCRSSTERRDVPVSSFQHSTAG